MGGGIVALVHVNDPQINHRHWQELLVFRALEDFQAFLRLQHGGFGFALPKRQHGASQQRAAPTQRTGRGPCRPQKLFGPYPALMQVAAPVPEPAQGKDQDCFEFVNFRAVLRPGQSGADIVMLGFTPIQPQHQIG